MRLIDADKLKYKMTIDEDGHTLLVFRSEDAIGVPFVERYIVPKWVVCFRCHNKSKFVEKNGRQVRVCHKCTRNDFAPGGGGKDDWFNKNIDDK